MENHYEINVSIITEHGRKHLFATAPRSIRDEGKLKEVLPTFLEKFPACEGYKVSVTHWKGSGTEIDPTKIV